ncbi:MAG: transposase [Proteobacteria bacterium]|nr:transposase [Pseudomonadota bacterium]
MSSDGGGLLLKEIDQSYRITEWAAAGLRDGRRPGKINHDLLDPLRQRVATWIRTGSRSLHP